MGIWYPHKHFTKNGFIPYAGSCPPYYDLRGIPWFDKLTNDIPAIQNKVFELLAGKRIDTVDYYNDSLVDGGNWELIIFLTWNLPKKIPGGDVGNELFSYFRDIEGIVTLGLSILKPGTHIKPHNGDTDATYRMHIPIVIPKGLPECGLKVAGIEKAWEDNAIITFCDAHLHEAWNYSDKTRIILVADIIKPEYLPRTRKICTEVLTWLFLQQIAGIKMLPRIIKILIAGIMLIGMRPLFYLLQRRPK